MTERRAILIVDNDPNLIWFVSKMCQGARDYEILKAGSGKEALKLLQDWDGRIDAVLLDPRMPGMGGLEVLKSIRYRHREVPLLVLTALEDQEKACDQIGVDAFLKKPYSLEELDRHLERVFEKAPRSSLALDPAYEPCAKILIVDDEPEVSELLAASLTEDLHDAKYDVKACHSGDEALRLSLEFEPDIAIVDIKMPHMWGDELIQRFKAGEGHTPKDFLIYTSVADPDQVARVKKLGYAFLTKPVHLEVLADALKRACLRHRLLRKK